MNLNPVHTGRRAMLPALFLVVLVLTLPVFIARAAAQEKPDGAQAAGTPANSPAASAQQKPDFGSYQTIYLTNVTSDRDANDIQTDLRNMLPRARIYYVPSQHALSIEGSAGDIQSAQRMISEIDHPLKTFRLTFSLTEMDGDRAAGTQKISLIAVDDGEKTIFKRGSKVPIITGISAEGSSAQNSQVQYEDVGLSIEAAVDGSPDLLRLRTKIAQSSVPGEREANNTGDPAIRQTTLETGAALVPGKPLVLGSLDVPGTTRREEIQVVSELVQ
jgi:type II secretory pathway component GspD/PulD (secretin)